MQLDSTFSVVAPIDTVWNTLMDFEGVAGCVPGAQILNKLSEDAYQVGMKVKLGPVTMQYRGQLNVIERDGVAHRAVLEGSAKETRGQGTAQATVTLVLTETDGRTEGTVNADLALSGKAAAMGKGVIGSVTDQMMALFAQNLQAMLAEEPSGAVGLGDSDAGGETAAGGTAAASGDGGAAASSAGSLAGAQSAAPQRAAAAAPETSLDAFALAKGMLAEQMASPAKAFGLLVLVACIAYRVGRRVGQRNG